MPIKPLEGPAQILLAHVGMPDVHEEVGAVGEAQNSTVLPWRLSATKYCSACAIGQRKSASPCSNSTGVSTAGAYVRGERSTIAANASGRVPPHCRSPKLTPISDVPYMLGRSRRAPPTPAALQRRAWPITPAAMKPP